MDHSEDNSVSNKTDSTERDTGSTKKRVGNSKTPEKAKRVGSSKIPVTPEEVEASNNRIIDAYVANGLIYKEKLNDTKEAVKIFQTLLMRFPDNNYLAKVYYYLYKCYEELANDTAAKKYRELVLDKFPESDYANIIKNTGKNNTSAGGSEETKYYEATYEMYKSGDYAGVKSRCESAHSKYAKSNLIGKFDYLKALAIGKTESEANFKQALEEVVKNYPNTDVYVAANNILDYFKRKNNPQPEPTSTAAYVFSPTSEHFYMLITDESKANIETLKANYSDYNAEYHRLESFEINSYILGEKTKIIIIKSFPNSAKSISYYRELINNTLFFEKVGLEEYSQCVISDQNFKIMMKKKDDDEYLNFFRENYK